MARLKPGYRFVAFATCVDEWQGDDDVGLEVSPEPDSDTLVGTIFVSGREAHAYIEDELLVFELTEEFVRGYVGELKDHPRYWKVVRDE